MIARPVRGFDAASRGVATICTCAPIVIVAVSGASAIVVTGSAIVRLAAPVLPPAVAEIVTAPAPTPVTMPSALTVALARSVLPHVTGWQPKSSVPDPSIGEANS